MPVGHLIHCRARLVPECYHGSLTERQFEEDLPLSYDNTWDGQRPGTIVCDPCYLAIQPFSKSGQALTDEIPDAIAAYRTNRDHVQASKDLQPLIDEAKGWIAKAHPGTPAHRSASACLRMAQGERRRREAA